MLLACFNSPLTAFLRNKLQQGFLLFICYPLFHSVMQISLPYDIVVLLQCFLISKRRLKSGL